MNGRASLILGAAIWSLAGCGGAPRPVAVGEPAPPDVAAMPVRVEPAPRVPLPGEQPSQPLPLAGRSLLPNGLNVIVLRPAADRTNTARLLLHFGAGTAMGKQGVCDLAAWLFVRAADASAGRPSLQRQLEALGGTLSLDLGLQNTTLNVRIDANRWQQALQAVSAALTAAPPGRSALELAQRELLTQRGRDLADEPVRAAARRFLLGDRGPGDHLASLRDRDPSEGVAFQTRHYRPDRSALVLEVPGDATAVVGAAQRLLTDWRATELPAEPAQPERSKPPRGVLWASDGDHATCRAGLVFALPEPTSADAPAAHLLQHCVTMDGLGGRLERLQQQSGLGDVRWEAEWLHCAEQTALVLTTTTTPARAAQLYELATRARRSLAELPPTPSEREIARSRTWLSLRRVDAASDTRLRALAMRLLAMLGEDQMLERLTDLEQPDALNGAKIATFLQLPVALIVVGGQPPDGLALQPFDRATDPLVTATAAGGGGDQLVAAATPWLEQALQAIGGKDRIARLTGFESTARIATEASPDVDETVQWTHAGTLHRSRRLLSVTIETDIRGKQWIESSGPDQVQLTPIEASWRLGETERHPLALLLGYARGQLRFRLLAIHKHEDREHVLLEAVTERFERLRLQLDRSSGLVRVVEAWSTAPDGSPTNAVDTWSDYRTVDGVRVPFRRVTVVDDGQVRRVADYSRVQPTVR